MIKTFTRDTLYLSLFTAMLAVNSWLLAASVLPVWAIPIAVLGQGLMFVGLMEAFHQAVHLNLHVWRPVNLWLGRLAGSHLGLGFLAYRRFHMAHHVNTNTADDPEKDFYQSPASRMGLWLYPFIYLFRNAGVINSGRYLRSEDRLVHRFEMISITVFRLLTIGFTVLYPWEMAIAYWLPYYVFFYIELYISQSQHYFSIETQVAPRGLQHYSEGMNMRLPLPLGFLCMYTNEHATHHVRASIKWYDTPARTRQDADHVRSIGVFDFLRVLFSSGAKRWTAQAEVVGPKSINEVSR